MSRELDIKICELQGHTIDRDGEYGVSIVTTSLSPNGGPQKNYYAIPPYSTDINAAMELVDEMGDDLCSMARWKQGEDDWYVAFNTGKLFNRHIVSPTLPEAICKAYLAWKGDSNE